MSDTETNINRFLKEPDPTTEAEYRASWKRWYGVIPSLFLESLKITAGQNGWRLEDK